MTTIGRILVSLAIAGIVSTALAYFQRGAMPDPTLFIAFLIATVATALLTNLPQRSPAAESRAVEGGQKRSPRRDTPRQPAVPRGPRVEGQVKWFNVSKGFGFITKDDGEEIFVHFRSIRGEGRRSLRDGQRVSFVVAETEKGPQAEDVDVV